MASRSPGAALRREQVQALGVLVKQPDLFTALEGIFVDMHADAQRSYDAAKDALVHAEGARAGALIAHGRLLALNDILDLFNRQKI